MSRSRHLRQLGQEVLIALARVAADDAAECRIRLQGRRVDAHRLPLDQARIGETLQNPGEDGLVSLEILNSTFTTGLPGRSRATRHDLEDRETIA